MPVVRSTEGGEVLGVVAAALRDWQAVMDIEPAPILTAFAVFVDMRALTLITVVDDVFTQGGDRGAGVERMTHLLLSHDRRFD